MRIFIKITFIFFLFTSTARADITSNLSAYWKLDLGTGTSAADSSGNGVTGTLSSAAHVTWVAGKVGPYSNAFDGSLSWISFTSPANGFVITTCPSGCDNTIGWTASAWVKPTSVGAKQYIMDWGAQAGNGVLLSMTAATKYSISFYGGNTCDGGTPVAKTWQLVTGTYDGTNLYLYVNGALVQTCAGGAPASCNHACAATDYIGTYSGGSFFWVGNMDDIRIYGRALSSDDVTELYNNGSSQGPLFFGTDF